MVNRLTPSVAISQICVLNFQPKSKTQFYSEDIFLSLLCTGEVWLIFNKYLKTLISGIISADLFLDIGFLIADESHYIPAQSFRQEHGVFPCKVQAFCQGSQVTQISYSWDSHVGNALVSAEFYY